MTTEERPFKGIKDTEAIEWSKNVFALSRCRYASSGYWQLFTFKEYRTLKLEAQLVTTLQAATGVRTLGNWISGQLTSIDQVANLLERQNLSTSNEEIQKTLSTAIVSQPAWQKLILVDSAGKRQFAAVQSGKSADNKIVTSDLSNNS